MVIFNFSLCLGLAAQAQTDYKTLIKKGMEQLNTTQLPEQKTAYHIKYDVRIDYWDSPAQTAQVEMHLSNKTAFFISDKVAFYRDEKDAFSIIKDAKKIMWMDAQGTDKLLQQQQRFLDIKNDFFEKANYSRITRKDEPEGLQLIKIVPTAAWRNDYEIDYILVELDTKRNQITRMLMQYTAIAEKKTVEYIYHQLDYNATVTYFDKRNAKSFVFSGTKLSAAYQGYELVDLRQQK